MHQTIAVSLFLLVSHAAAFAQAVAGFGGISGVVRDSSGAVVVNAKVDIVNESKGIKRSVLTNSDPLREDQLSQDRASEDGVQRSVADPGLPAVQVVPDEEHLVRKRQCVHCVSSASQ